MPFSFLCNFVCAVLFVRDLFLVFVLFGFVSFCVCRDREELKWPFGLRTPPEPVACQALERDLPLGFSAVLPCLCVCAYRSFLLDAHESGWRAINF